MALDPSILLQGRLPQMPDLQSGSDPLGGVAQFMKLKQLVQGQKESQQKQQEKMALRDLYQKYTTQPVQGGPIQLDRAGLISELAQTKPQQALKKQASLMEMDAKTAEAKLKEYSNKAELAGRILAPVIGQEDPALAQEAWTFAKQQLENRGLYQPGELMAQYDPNIVQGEAYKAFSADQLFRKLIEDKRLDRQIFEDERDYKVARVDKLRNDYKADLRVSSATKISVAFNKLQNQMLNGFQAFARAKEYEKDPTKKKKVIAGAQSSDLAAIYTIYKMIEENSSVMSGEYEAARAAGGLLDRLKSVEQQVVDGYILTDDQRAGFMRTALGLYKGQMYAKGQADREFIDESKIEGIDKKRVLKDVSAKKMPVELKKYLRKYGVSTEIEDPFPDIPATPENSERYQGQKVEVVTDPETGDFKGVRPVKEQEQEEAPGPRKYLDIRDKRTDEVKRVYPGDIEYDSIMRRRRRGR